MSTAKTETDYADHYEKLLAKARRDNVSYVWSGDVRRNPFLSGALSYGVDEGIITLEYTESEQESGWSVRWL